MASKQYTFQNRVSKYSFEDYSYTVIYVPEDVYLEASSGSKTSRIRVVAQIKNHTIKCALLPAGLNQHYILLSKNRQKELGVGVGDLLTVTFELDDPESVDVPEELLEALENHPAAKEEWDSLTAGKKRGFAYRVSSAKQTETRIKRAQEIIDSLLPLRGFFQELEKNRRKKKG